eukprot:scaffold1760_cov18-Prasinocladus_malaysianus.AAC.1
MDLVDEDALDPPEIEAAGDLPRKELPRYMNEPSVELACEPPPILLSRIDCHQPITSSVVLYVPLDELSVSILT